ncbi:MAG: UDP-N-acetylglucosamine 2-epimerase (non-hydrolyzing) [Firmicutes bacterium]|nr:UDP-N-acetylglucosamine 2-epimerase (non-hydrolyzing) [Bacillota bacterium]
MKVVSIVGARPQFIKAAVVSRALRRTPGMWELLVHTGQHYDDDMSGIFFTELEIPEPDYHLGVGSGSHGAQTGRMLEAVEQVLLQEKPERVLVYGDTNSTLAGALASAKLHIPVAHVEAGLRSFNRRMPEEINRVLADHTSDLLFAPTEAAAENLLREGIPAERVHMVGDVMYDAALFYGAKAGAESRILERLGFKPKEYILATVHRAENTDDPSRLRAIFGGLSEAAEDWPVILPLHPRTRKALAREGMLSEAERALCVIPPVGYLDMVLLEKNARLVATDSGGVPKEAYFYEVPSVIFRKEAVWVELVEMGWAVTIEPLSVENIAGALREHHRAKGSNQRHPYGNGQAAEKIVNLMQSG